MDTLSAKKICIELSNGNTKRIGYARVSSIGQNLDSQIDNLEKAQCGIIFFDQISGAKTDRPGWTQLMTYIRPEDSLVITELSRMTRSLMNLLEITRELEERQVEIISLRENIDTSTATGRCFLSMMGAIAQMERELKAERAAAGRLAAKARGRTGGRPKTDPAKLEHARVLYENSDQAASKVCSIVGIGKRTFFSYLAQKRKEEQISI